MNCQFFAAEANGDITISAVNNNITVGLHNSNMIAEGRDISTDTILEIAIFCLDKRTSPIEAAKDLVHKLSNKYGLRFKFGEAAHKNFQSRGEKTWEK